MIKNQGQQAEQGCHGADGGVGGWRETDLGAVIELITGFPFKSSKYTDNENDIKLLRGDNIVQGKLRWSNVKRWPKNDPLIDEKYFLREGDVVLAMDRPWIEAGLKFSVISRHDLPCLLVQRVSCLRGKASLVNSFLRYIIGSSEFTNFIRAAETGTAVPHISGSQINEFSFVLPPLPEQRAIASVLSSLDDKIDLLHRQNKTLEALAETLFRQWFVEEAEVGWKTVHIGDYVKTNISSIDKNFKFQTIRYLDTGSLTADHIEGYQKFEISAAPSRARRIVQHNDILISTVRPDQKHYGILKFPEDDVIVSTGFCVITCDKISPHFIYTFLTTDEMTEYLHSIAEGSTSTYPSLKPSDIEDLEFQLPPTDKLEAFSVLANNSWDKINYNQKQIRTLTTLRGTLLPKLMSGEVRVTV